MISCTCWARSAKYKNNSVDDAIFVFADLQQNLTNKLAESSASRFPSHYASTAGALK